MTQQSTDKDQLGKTTAAQQVQVEGGVSPNTWIVELYGGTQFLAPWGGDPGRTCVKDYAKRYKTKHAANCALARIKKLYPRRDYFEARVVEG